MVCSTKILIIIILPRKTYRLPGVSSFATQLESMKNELWDKHVMDDILAVNKNLHKGGLLPEKAQRMLYGLEDCLCSGDGLSTKTSFWVMDERVAEKAMELLGMDYQGP